MSEHFKFVTKIIKDCPRCRKNLEGSSYGEALREQEIFEALDNIAWTVDTHPTLREEERRELSTLKSEQLEQTIHDWKNSRGWADKDVPERVRERVLLILFP